MSPELEERSRRVVARDKAPRPFAAKFAGRCRCGARWQPGAVIFLAPLKGGPPPACFDCGLADGEARK